MNQGLTSFRAFAFFAVFLFHERLAEWGYLGVHAFFILSGFLLTPIILDMKKEFSGKQFFTQFYGRRALRIFPLYYFYIFLITCLATYILLQHPEIRIDDYHFKQLPWLLTYTYNFFHITPDFTHVYTFSHFWSLSVEEQFYLFWPVIIYFTPMKNTKAILIAFILSGPFIRALTYLLLSSDSITIFRGNHILAIYLLPTSYLDAFAIGGYFALYGKPSNTRSVYTAFIFLIAIGLITDWLFHQKFTWQAGGYAPLMKDSYKYIWGYSVCALFIAYMLVNIRDNRFLPSLLNHPVLVYLGTISYGLYVYHYFIIWLVNHLAGDLIDILQAALSLTFTIIVASLSYHLLEKRFILQKDKYFPRKKPND